MAVSRIIRRAPITSEIATSANDIDYLSGYLGRLENPDTVLQYESAGRGVRIYEDMERDWQVFSALQVRSLTLQACEWSVTPASEKRSDVKMADFITAVFKRANFDALTHSLMQAVLTGYKPVEIMWERSEGDIWVEDFRGRRPSRFQFDKRYRLRLLTPASIVEGELVPERKFVVWSYGGHDHNPYGVGLGNRLYWPVWFRKNGVKFWVRFAEKFGTPTAVGKYPPGTDQASRETLTDAIAAIEQETGITIPDTMAIELLEAQRQSSANTYADMCGYFDRAIAKIILGQTLTTEPGTSGSYSLGQVHNDVRMDLLKSDADLMCERINNTVVRWLVDYNFPAPAQYPHVWRRTEPPKDLAALAARDKILLVDMGMGARVPETYIQDTYDIPLAADGKPTITAQQFAPAGAGQSALQLASARQFAEQQPEVSGQQAVDALATNVSIATAPDMDAMLQPVIDAVGGATDIGTLGAAIYAIYPAISMDRFQTLLALAMFAAAAEGRLAVTREQ